MNPRVRQTYLCNISHIKKRKKNPPVPEAEDYPIIKVNKVLTQPFLFKDITEKKPIIIPRSEHPISRKNIDREALKVLYRLKDSGHLAYLVGGSVRDLLLGRKPKDFDIGTDARPEELRKLFRHSRIIGRRFRLVHVYFRGGKIIEVSTFRQTSGCNDELHPEEYNENIYGTPEQDAFRRDLTINGLFYNIADFSIIDYVGGMEDLKQGIIRTIGDPERRFLRDPVRMMRAVRHAARTGFNIEEHTWQAIKRHANKIKFCSIARVRDEYIKDLKSGAAKPWAELLIDSGLIENIFPSYKKALEVNKKKTKKILLNLMGFIDQKIKSGDRLDDALILSFFFFPALYADECYRALSSSKKLRWPIYESRILIEDIILPYEFRRDIRDRMSKILAGYWSIDFCAKTNTWPKKVKRRQSFFDSFMLYNLVQQSENKPSVTISKNKKRKRNKRRKKKD